MARHGFGKGEYFAYPLPEIVGHLRKAVYPHAARMANRWGGEFVLTEQRPRMQSRAEVVPLAQGEAVLFAVNERPRRGRGGYHRAKMRHGVSRMHSGQRFTLGLIFRDAA